MKNYRQCNRLVGACREAIQQAYDKGYEQAKTDFKRRDGKWIPVDTPLGRQWKCDGCNSIEVGMYLFCPTCGSDMRKYLKERWE